MVRGGRELGKAMDVLVDGLKMKQAAGAGGILPDGLVDRQRADEILVPYALAHFLTPHYWTG